MDFTKLKYKEHPAWQAYAFECVNAEIFDQGNEYAKFRNWIISKVSLFIILICY